MSDDYYPEELTNEELKERFAHFRKIFQSGDVQSNFILERLLAPPDPDMDEYEEDISCRQ